MIAKILMIKKKTKKSNFINKKKLPHVKNKQHNLLKHNYTTNVV